MGVIRKVIDSELLLNIIDIPENLKNKKVEILVRPLPMEPVLGKKRKLVRGMLGKYKNIELLDQESVS